MDIDDSVPFEPERPSRGRRNSEQPAPVGAPGDTAPPGSDEALALWYAERHADTLRYVAQLNEWRRWGGTRWERVRTLEHLDYARQLTREHAAELSGKAAVDGASARKVSAAIFLARADRRMAAVVEQWDADPWLLNTPAGVVDLRTGDSRPHDRNDYMTKVTAVAPGGECPLWLAFLDRVTGGDADLVLYLQRLAGYCLTGLTREHVLAFLYGTGANGKSVFLETLSWIMGEYAAAAPIETFTEIRGERHPTELAGLAGARLVTATETDAGRAWAESRIKALTGGDRIAARFMRGDFFEFVPQFTLIVAGNHKPRLRNVDEAIQRRLHMVPFGVTIPVDERDDELGVKLRAEGGGILSWAIEGAIEWGGYGLAPPEAVRGATADYLAAEDAIGRWLDEWTYADPQATTETAALFQSWSGWAEVARERVGSLRWFSQTMQDRGWKPCRLTGGKRAFAGIALQGAVGQQ